MDTRTARALPTGAEHGSPRERKHEIMHFLGEGKGTYNPLEQTIPKNRKGSNAKRLMIQAAINIVNKLFPLFGREPTEERFPSSQGERTCFVRAGDAAKSGVWKTWRQPVAGVLSVITRHLVCSFQDLDFWPGRHSRVIG
ncbi:MAG: hypothetical protein ACE15F_17910 [bacterium]